jgi:hypothetical protein
MIVFTRILLTLSVTGRQVHVVPHVPQETVGREWKICGDRRHQSHHQAR